MADAGLELTITLEGLENASKHLDPGHLIAPPIKEFFQAATLIMLNEAMAQVPVDLADLQRSHTMSIDPAPLPLWGKVVANKFYAPYVELGTLPHVVPIWAIKPWALRHNINVYALAAKIKKYGTRPNPWMLRTQGIVTPKIQDLWGRVLKRIQVQWRS